jgi:Outer membrane protein beta-barrel domain
MRKSFIVMGAALLSVSLAAAEDVPKMEGFVGYNFVRFNPNSSFIPSLNANGGGGQVVYNVNKWIGAVFDLGAVTKGTIGGFNVDATVINFVAGPRVTFRNSSRFTPFAQVLFGGAYSTASLPISLLPANGIILPPAIIVPPNSPITARLNASRTGFAMLAGGGLDIRVNKHMSFRPIGADYYLTRMPSLLTGNDSNRNNFRYSAGVNFLFGAQ